MTEARATKRCPQCGLHLSSSFFYSAKSRTDGLSSLCIPCSKKHAAHWNNENREKVLVHKKEWRAKNLDRARAVNKKNYKKWYVKNGHKINAKYAKRRSDKMSATPPWFDKNMKYKVDELYNLARGLQKYTGKDHHVDHIHPLVGENFCGLHVPWNLQVLSAAENTRKSNMPPPSEADLFFEAPKWTITLSQYRAGLTLKSPIGRQSESSQTAPSSLSLAAGKVSPRRSFVLKWLTAAKKSASTSLTTGAVQMKKLIKQTRNLREFLIFLRAMSLKVV